MYYEIKGRWLGEAFEKFRRYSRWEPKISLEMGIRRTVKEIKESKDYNPLEHLEEAKEKGVDLTNFY